MLKHRPPAPGSRSRTRRFLDHDGPIAAAHRGGAAEAPANSPPAVSLTAALGFYLETDVSVTRDGVPVLRHPRGLARLMPWRPLRFDATAGSAYPLEDVLVGHPDLRVMIDVKQWPAVAVTAIAIARAGAGERVSIGTFSQARTDATARAIHEITGDDVCTALGLRRLLSLAFGRADRVRDGREHTAQLPHRLITRRFLGRARAAGVQVIAWTVNDEARMRRLLDMGVDGIITDHPSRLRGVLIARSSHDGNSE